MEVIKARAVNSGEFYKLEIEELGLVFFNKGWMNVINDLSEELKKRYGTKYEIRLLGRYVTIKIG